MVNTRSNKTQPAAPILITLSTGLVDRGREKVKVKSWGRKGLGTPTRGGSQATDGQNLEMSVSPIPPQNYLEEMEAVVEQGVEPEVAA